MSMRISGKEFVEQIRYSDGDNRINQQEYDKLGEYLNGNATEADKNYVKAVRKAVARENRMNAAAEKSYTGEEINKTLKKDKDLELVLVKNGLLQQNEDRTFNIKALSDYIRSFAHVDNVLNSDEVDDLKASFLKMGIEVNNKQLRSLLKLCDIDVDKKNYLTALYEGTIGAVVNAFSSNKGEMPIINTEGFRDIKNLGDMEKLLDAQKLDADSKEMIMSMAANFVEFNYDGSVKEGDNFDSQAFVAYLDSIGGFYLNKNEMIVGSYEASKPVFEQDIDMSFSINTNDKVSVSEERLKQGLIEEGINADEFKFEKTDNGYKLTVKSPLHPIPDEKIQEIQTKLDKILNSKSPKETPSDDCEQVEVKAETYTVNGETHYYKRESDKTDWVEITKEEFVHLKAENN